jgi:hypothetical protein
VIHGSQIPGCPHNRPILCLPFAIGSCYDAVGAWIWLNSKFFHCYVCPANHEQSKTFPAPAAKLPPRTVHDTARLRRKANNSAETREARHQARLLLAQQQLHSECTAHDDLALTQMGGEVNVIPDTLHCGDGGTNKHLVVSIKKSCGVERTVSGRPHAVSAAAAVINDFVTMAGGFNTGYHRLPSVKGFTGVQVFSASMIRSLTFSLNAAFVSVPDLFRDTQLRALIRTLTVSTLLLRNINRPRWSAVIAANLRHLYTELGLHWDDAVGGFATFQRSIVHLASHWEDLFLRLGAPVQWSTMHFIESMQRVLKAAWRFTNKVNPSAQVMRRLALLKYVSYHIFPDIGLCDDVIAALQEDRGTEANLRGAATAAAGANTLFQHPAIGAETDWNRALTKAMTAFIQRERPDDLPRHHRLDVKRMLARASGFFSRRGVCAVSVPVCPRQSADADERERQHKPEHEHAIFSVFEPAPHAPGAAADAPDPPPIESETKRFMVDFWLSYDFRDLSEAAPNAPAPALRLKTAEWNDAANAVDLAVGHHMDVLPGLGSDAADTAEADVVFQRVKPKPTLSIVDIGHLCKPLWTFPYLGSTDAAKQFFRTASSKWDADTYLVCSKLF